MEQLESHYGVHLELPIFAGLVNLISSSSRGNQPVDIGRNVIHGSDASETAQFDIGIKVPAL